MWRTGSGSGGVLVKQSGDTFFCLSSLSQISGIALKNFAFLASNATPASKITIICFEIYLCLTVKSLFFIYRGFAMQC